MDKESAHSIFFLRNDKDECLLWNLQHLAHKLIVRLRHQAVTQRTLWYIEETDIFIARVTEDLRNRLPPDSSQPTRLNDGHTVDFSNLQ